jgi:hypothetical protein
VVLSFARVSWRRASRSALPVVGPCVLCTSTLTTLYALLSCARAAEERAQRLQLDRHHHRAVARRGLLLRVGRVRQGGREEGDGAVTAAPRPPAAVRRGAARPVHGRAAPTRGTPQPLACQALLPAAQGAVCCPFHVAARCEATLCTASPMHVPRACACGASTAASASRSMRLRLLLSC